MANNDGNPEGAGAVTPEGTEPQGTTPQNSDPLDSIQDVETLRAESKKFRAIAARFEKSKSETPPAKPMTVTPPKGEFITRSDFELANQKKAVRIATAVLQTDSEESKQRKADMLANLESVQQFYTPRKGKDTPEDIADDLDDAYTIFRKNSPVKKADGTKELVESRVVQGTGAGATPPTPTQDPPGFKKIRGPDEWYPKKS